MSSIRHILVPTDGSDNASKAAALAGELARAFKARITLLVVIAEESVMPSAWGVRPGPGGGPQGTMTVEQIRSALEQRAREDELPKTQEALGDLDVKPESVTVWGHPADAIRKYAEENEVDLIVLGSHGRTGIKRAFLGSVSQAVANQAKCPVTIVK